MSGSDTIPGSDGRPRCRWCTGEAAFEHYHDTEWGFPLADDRRLFEKLSLEGTRSGQSWRTRFEQRDTYRRAFDDFDFQRIARYDTFKIRSLLQNDSIDLKRDRIEAIIHNAGRALKLQTRHGSLAAFLWAFETPRNTSAPDETPTESPASVLLSKALKRHGWQFVAPSVTHGFMQAVGLCNDHVAGCVTRADVERARAAFKPPVDQAKSATD